MTRFLLFRVVEFGFRTLQTRQTRLSHYIPLFERPELASALKVTLCPIAAEAQFSNALERNFQNYTKFLDLEETVTRYIRAECSRGMVE